MKCLVLALAFTGISGAAATGVAQLPASGAAPRVLTVGDEAPPFSLLGSDGKTYRLSDYRGKQVVILAWFARAFSGG
jgi:peroxiredoxin Q/BCP